MTDQTSIQAEQTRSRDAALAAPIVSRTGWTDLDVRAVDTARLLAADAGLPEPELAAAPSGALAVACGFWTLNRLNALADLGDIAGVTRRINGGTEGLAQRRAWLARVEAAFAASGSA